LRGKPLCVIVVFGKGAEAQGLRSKINLTEPTLPQVHHTNTEEDHHGCEEEEKGKGEDEVNDLRKPRIGAALSTSEFARSS
jgi:hypothetical protein